MRTIIERPVVRSSEVSHIRTVWVKMKREESYFLDFSSVDLPHDGSQMLRKLQSGIEIDRSLRVVAQKRLNLFLLKRWAH